MINLARQRVHGHLWPILQTAVAAVGAWWVAVLAGVEQRPTFAAIAAIISLGAAFGERRQRAVQLIAGVMLGIVLADLLVRAIGVGVPQIGLLVVMAMVAAVIL
ncbi:MAG: FUSC family protein, partial [Solirubrobacteraceae bacterium]